MGGPMHKAPETDFLTADEPLLEIQIPWADGSREHDAGSSSHPAGRWQPRRTILVSLVVSLALWAAIMALILWAGV